MIMKIRISFITGFIIILFFPVTMMFSQKQGDKVFIGIGFCKHIIPEADILDVQISLKLWTNELNKLMGLNYQTDPVIIESIPEMMDAIAKHQVHLISMSSIDYIAIREKAPVNAELTVSSGRDNPNRFVLLVHRNNSIQNLESLRNKKLILPSMSTGTMLKMWLDTLLLKNNLQDSDDYFEQIKYVSKESQIILNLFFKQADACVVSRSAFETMNKLNPQVGNDLLVIAESPELVRSIICLVKNLDPLDRNRIIDSALKLDSFSYGKQFQTLFRFDKVMPVSDSEIKSIETLVREYNTLQAKH